MKISSNFMDKQKKVKWSEKTPKEKLDFIFVCIAIGTFATGLLLNIRHLTKEAKALKR
jgi:hypothetical protein